MINEDLLDDICRLVEQANVKENTIECDDDDPKQTIKPLIEPLIDSLDDEETAQKDFLQPLQKVDDDHREPRRPRRTSFETPRRSRKRKGFLASLFSRRRFPSSESQPKSLSFSMKSLSLSSFFTKKRIVAERKGRNKRKGFSAALLDMDLPSSHSNSSKNRNGSGFFPRRESSTSYTLEESAHTGNKRSTLGSSLASAAYEACSSDSVRLQSCSSESVRLQFSPSNRERKSLQQPLLPESHSETKRHQYAPVDRGMRSSFRHSALPQSHSETIRHQYAPVDRGMRSSFRHSAFPQSHSEAIRLQYSPASQNRKQPQIPNSRTID